MLASLIHVAIAAAVVPSFGHAFVIVGENTSYGEVTRARAPYVAGTLRRRGASLTDYRAFGDSKSLGEYMGMVSGQYTRCEARDGEPAECRQDVPSLFGQLGDRWRAWQGSMPQPCAEADAGPYVAHHNPALYFSGLSDACPRQDLPLDGLRAALASGDVGALNLVVPDNCDNGHDPCGGDGVRHFDAFLRRWVPRIERSPAFARDGVLFVVWDEGGDPPNDPDHVAALVLGPRVRAGARVTARRTHYGLERTLAQGLGVAPLGHARRAKPILGIWR